MSAPRKKKPLLTLSDLESVQVEQSSITRGTESSAESSTSRGASQSDARMGSRTAPQDADAPHGTADQASPAPQAADGASASQDAGTLSTSQEEALAAKLGEAEARQDAYRRKAERRQHLMLALIGALGAGLLVALLFLIFQPTALDSTELRATNGVPPDLPQPEVLVGFLPEDIGEDEANAEETDAAPPARERRPRSRPSRDQGSPEIDTGSLF